MLVAYLFCNMNQLTLAQVIHEVNIELHIFGIHYICNIQFCFYPAL